MEQDVKKILEVLEEIKKDIDYIKSKIDKCDDDGTRQKARRISTNPDLSASYTKVREKSKWDVDSIDGLIE